MARRIIMQTRTIKTRPIMRHHRPARRRGVAMILVMIALSVATILSASFLAAQSTTTRIASNVQHHGHARYIAESGVDLALAYIRSDSAWRDRGEGTWADDADLAGGTFTLAVHDGEDTDGDGNIDGDGDLTDDDNDTFTISVTGNYSGVTHSLDAVVQPEAGQNGKTILLIVRDGDDPGANDAARKSLLEGWGYTVNVLDDNASDSEYDNAIAQSDVVYVSERVSSGNVAGHLSDTSKGVVSEEGYLNDSLGLSNQNGPGYNDDRIDIDDNSHYITSQFSTGQLTLTTARQSLRRHNGSIADGAQVLGDMDYSNTPTLAVLDRGAEDIDGDSTAGRRVFLPWGDSNFNISQLTNDGRTLLKRSIEWASKGGGGGGAGAYGVAAMGKIELKGNARIDSFDSSQGAYSWSNRGENAVVATDSDANDIIEMKGSSKIKGDVHIGPNGDTNEAVDHSWSTEVTGEVKNLSSNLSMSVSDPGIGGAVTSPDIPNWGEKNIGDPGGSEQTYRWNQLETGGSVDVNIVGPVTALVEGDVDFGGGSEINITDNGSLTLYVKGDFEVSGNVPVNFDTNDPSKMQVYMLDDGEVELKGNGRMYGTIVGPESDGEIKGNADLYGLFHGKSLELKGSGALHHDVSTTGIGANAGSNGDGDDSSQQSGTTYKVTWREP